MTEGRSSRRPSLPGWADIIGTRGAVQIGVIAALIVWLYWDQVYRLVWFWRSELDWSHGFLIVPFSLYLIHQDRDRIAQARIQQCWSGAAMMAVGIWAYAFCVKNTIVYPQAMTMLVVIAGAVVLMVGWQVLRHTAFPMAFLILAMPPPERYYRSITQPLQQFAAAISDLALGLLPGVTMVRNGINLSALDVSGNELAQFTVAGACSGMRSLLAFITLGMMMAFLTPRPIWHRAVMVLIVVPVALFCNCIRVVVTGLLMIYDWSDFASGTAHSLLGIGTFALGILIYSFVLYLMDHLFVDETEAGSTPAGASA
ncbi:MAG: exosortase/archaeosortase family protein [Phycisphaerae bacterium]|nr:exosortase/archaeosortase family protein [Phycisphaerae bacterium]NUQ46176.1 exosortase/archaeosortase family protein [Phycisphaerae bacterium]